MTFNVPLVKFILEHVFMGSLLSLTQYKNHKSSQILHAGP